MSRRKIAVAPGSATAIWPMAWVGSMAVAVCERVMVKSPQNQTKKYRKKHRFPDTADAHKCLVLYCWFVWQLIL
ncbi:hypothetical protein LHGZ1_1547 [Laribacter hongkongensis]|uniref:Uncharacterized protein n=1 Tax=Laribacter hongkongensis TaxID=168471 RepID=A0A248LHZ5_9NEIS|nr:hypothetical protein LHGZ1_1547 [Laribacter hongkongensis]